MDERPLQYSRHARERMIEHHVSDDEVEAIVRYAAWRRRSSDGKVLHYGYSDDGRLFKIVTNRYEDRVVSVIDERRRWRRNRKRR